MDDEGDRLPVHSVAKTIYTATTEIKKTSEYAAILFQNEEGDGFDATYVIGQGRECIDEFENPTAVSEDIDIIGEHLDRYRWAEHG